MVQTKKLTLPGSSFLVELYKTKNKNLPLLKAGFYFQGDRFIPLLSFPPLSPLPC